jgi:aspartate aminotransferase/aminotransferase
MFSKIINKIPEALSIYFNQIVYDQKSSGVDIITLSLGEAYFDIPLFDFKNLDLNKIHHYTSSLGLEKLRQKLSKYYLNNYKSKFDHQKEILISTGSKPLIYMAIKSIIDPGDEVVVLEPAWLSYKEQITLCGGKTKFINFDENIENINKYISNKTKLIIVNNPNNPSGKIYSKKELKYLIKFCIKKKKFGF